MGARRRPIGAKGAIRAAASGDARVSGGNLDGHTAKSDDGKLLVEAVQVVDSVSLFGLTIADGEEHGDFGQVGELGKQVDEGVL